MLSALYSKHEGDVLCLSVMSHLNKCSSSGRADLAFSLCIHHINAIWQKHHICTADSTIGPKVCDSVSARVSVCVCWRRGCVQAEKKNKTKGKKDRGLKKINKEIGRTLQQIVKLRPGGLFSYLHMQISGHPQIPTLIKKNQLKLSYLMFTLINHNN